MTDPIDPHDPVVHRALAVAANNATWELLADRTSPDQFTPDEVDDVLARAYAATFHWARAADRTAANAARGAWLVSRVHAVLGNGELALHHADRCQAIVADAQLDDFDLGYGHEARARALASLGRLDEARAEHDLAVAVPIADDEDREIYEADLVAEPWFGLLG
ncbi:MAG: hypothetical protein ABWZ42_12135 [Ilumatobacteraceae bacterium]